MNSFRALSALLVAAGLFTLPALAAEPIEALVRERAQVISQAREAHLSELSLMARMPVVHEYFRVPDNDRESRLKAVEAALTSRQMNSELSLIDEHGSEHLRAVRGHLTPASALAKDAIDAPFFADGIHLVAGESHQSQPYASPDVEEWVVAYVVPVIPGRAILHFEHPLKEIQALATEGVTDPDRFILVVDEQGLIYGDSRRKVNLSTTGDNYDPAANFENILNAQSKLPPALVADIISEPNNATKAAWGGGTWDVAWKRIGSLILVGIQRQS